MNPTLDVRGGLWSYIQGTLGPEQIEQVKTSVLRILWRTVERLWVVYKQLITHSFIYLFNSGRYWPEVGVEGEKSFWLSGPKGARFRKHTNKYKLKDRYNESGRKTRTDWGHVGSSGSNLIE